MPLIGFNQLDNKEIYDNQSLSANYLSKRASDGVLLSNSRIYDNGTYIGIGTSTSVEGWDVIVEGKTKLNNKIDITPTSNVLMSFSGSSFITNPSNNTINLGGTDNSWTTINTYASGSKKTELTGSNFNIFSNTGISGTLTVTGDILNNSTSFKLGYSSNNVSINNSNNKQSFSTSGTEKFVIESSSISANNIGNVYFSLNNGDNAGAVYLHEGYSSRSGSGTPSLFFSDKNKTNKARLYSYSNIFYIESISGPIILSPNITASPSKHLIIENDKAKFEMPLEASSFRFIGEGVSTTTLETILQGTGGFQLSNQNGIGIKFFPDYGIWLKRPESSIYFEDYNGTIKTNLNRSISVIDDVDTTTRFVFGSDGFNGIGSYFNVSNNILPQAPLDIRKLSSPVTSYVLPSNKPNATLNLLNPSTTANTGPSIVFGTYYNGTSAAANGMIQVSRLYNSTSESVSAISGKMSFYTGGPSADPNNGELKERLTIDSLGNVGINNSSPSATLDIVGTQIKLKGTDSKISLYNGSNQVYGTIGATGSSKLYINANSAAGNQLSLEISGFSKFMLDSSNIYCYENTTFSKNINLGVGDNSKINFNEGLASIASSATGSSTSLMISTNNKILLQGANSSDSILYNGNKVWHAGNDGTDSGLDADLLDGLNSTDFSRYIKFTLANNNMNTDGTLPGIYSYYGTNIENRPKPTLSAYAINSISLGVRESGRYSSQICSVAHTNPWKDAIYFRNLYTDVESNLQSTQWYEMIHEGNWRDIITFPERTKPLNSAGTNIDFDMAGGSLTTQPVAILGRYDDTTFKNYNPLKIKVGTSINVDGGGAAVSGISNTGYYETTYLGGDNAPAIRIKGPEDALGQADIAFWSPFTNAAFGIHNYTFRMSFGEFKMYFSSNTTPYHLSTSPMFRFTHTGEIYANGVPVITETALNNKTFLTYQTQPDDNTKPILLYQSNSNTVLKTSTIRINDFNGQGKMTIPQLTTYSITCTGDIQSGTFSSTSSKRYKTNINTLQNSLEKVGKLRGVSYNLISNDSSHIGLIAEEVIDVIPEVVKINDNNEPESINYPNMVALLVEAIKDLQKELISLKEEVNILKGA